MTLMHKLLAATLRAAGRHRDAAEVEEAASPEPARRPAPPELIPEMPDLPASPPARIASDDRETTARAAGSADRGSSASRTGPADSGPGIGGGDVGSSPQAGAGSGKGSSGIRPGQEEAEAEQERLRDPSRPGALPGQAHNPAAAGPPMLADDPLAGLHSERLRERLERDAFRTASTTAQDTAIWRSAANTLPPDVLCQFKPSTPHPGASSKAARSARIDALRGQIPEWAQGDPQNDPALLRAGQPRTRGHTAPRAAMPAPTSAPIRGHDTGRER